MRIGCHLSIKDGYLHALEEAISLGANTFQYFSRNPQGGKAKEWDQKDFDAFLDLAARGERNGIICL